MTFILKPIDLETFDKLWTPTVAKLLDKYIHFSEHTRKSLPNQRWVVDEGANAYLFIVSLADRLDGAFSYVLLKDGEFALIREEGYCLYSLVTVSAGLAGQLDEIKRLTADSLRVGGKFLDGQTEVSLFMVPNAQFVSHSKSKAY
jgi:hypothetical protein